MTNNYKRLKLACYATSVSTSVVTNLSPLLFLIFHSQYNISFSLLGLLVLINFCTQLAVDLLFSFFTDKFNIEKSIKLSPVLATVGFLVYALLPMAFPSMAYFGIVVGTIIFSSAGGLVEVLLSPVIAAIPAKDPDREMSKLHSVYAWGVVGIAIVGTLFLHFLGSKNWCWLVVVFALIPFTASILFQTVDVPTMKRAEKGSGTANLMKNKGVWLCVIAIFFGGASELIMGQWCSGYIESALKIPKALGDIFGVALFSLTLGFGRTLYSKIGKNIFNALIWGATFAFVCYVVAAITSLPILGLIVCAVTGFCVSMLWPGSLIVATSKFPSGGVVVFALMASGGDLGAAVGPQLVGIVTDIAISNPTLLSLAERLALSPEQLGMKMGMLVGALFALCAVIMFILLKKTIRKTKKVS